MVRTVIPDLKIFLEPMPLNDMINSHDAVGGVAYISDDRSEVVYIATRTDRSSYHSEVIELSINDWYELTKGNYKLIDAETLIGNVSASDLNEAIGFVPFLADLKHNADQVEEKAYSFVSVEWLNARMEKYGHVEDDEYEYDEGP